MSWELFSSSVYSYRQGISENKKHKAHAFLKTSLLFSVTSVEAFLNEVLLREKGYSKSQLSGLRSFEEKFEIFDLDFPEYTSKKIRNNFLVHHKRVDQKYFVKINRETVLESIEVAQEIIARVSFKEGSMFPYWITGVNFVNPLDNHDICLVNDYEFWRHVRWSGIFKGIENIFDITGTITPPQKWEDYKLCYSGLWDLIKSSNFTFDNLTMKDSRFPHMPYLTVNFWDEL